MSDLFQQLYDGDAAQIQRQFETQIDLDPYLITYGASALFAFTYGLYLNRHYGAQMIQRTPLPRASGDCINDSLWAKHTVELTAWRRASNWWMASNGWMFLTWAANYIMDNEGGTFHTLFHVSKRFMFIQPLVNFVLATNVVRAHPRYFEVTTNQSSYADCMESYFFDWRVSDTTDATYLPPSYRDHMWNMYLYTVLQALVISYTQEHLVAQYHDASEWRESLEHEDEEHDMEHDDAAEEAEEEDFDEFF